MTNEPVTVVKPGYFIGDLKEALAKYRSGFRELLEPAFDHENYGLYEPATPSLILVTRQDDGFRLKGPHRVNMFTAFTSYSNHTNFEMLEEFERKTGIALYLDMEDPREAEGLMAFAFKGFIQHGPEFWNELTRL